MYGGKFIFSIKIWANVLAGALNQSQNSLQTNPGSLKSKLMGLEVIFFFNITMLMNIHNRK